MKMSSIHGFGSRRANLGFWPFFGCLKLFNDNQWYWTDLGLKARAREGGICDLNIHYGCKPGKISYNKNLEWMAKNDIFLKMTKKTERTKIPSIQISGLGGQIQVFGLYLAA